MKKFTISLSVLLYLALIGWLLAAIIEVPEGGARMNVMIVGGGTPATTTEASCSTSNDVELEPNISQTQVNAGTFDAATDMGAQSFTETTNFTVTGYYIHLRDNNATGNVTAELQLDSGGDPDGSTISGTSVTLGHADVGPSYGDVWFELLSPVTGLSSSTTYWLVVSVDATGDFSWGKDTADDYANGLAQISSNGGSSWSPWATNDYIFDIYGCTE
jgi:hypothetical protein